MEIDGESPLLGMDSLEETPALDDSSVLIGGNGNLGKNMNMDIDVCEDVVVKEKAGDLVGVGNETSFLFCRLD